LISGAALRTAGKKAGGMPGKPDASRFSKEP